MGLLQDFASAIKDLVTVGYRLNRDQRSEMAQIVGELGDEMARAFSLTVAYLDGSRGIQDSVELAAYLRQGRQKLGTSFNEFRVCHGIRRLADRFDRWFDPVRGAVNVGRIGKIKDLITSLESGERIMFDDLGDLFDRLDDIASELEGPSSLDDQEALRTMALPKVVKLERIALLAKSKQINELAREILDTV